MKKIIFSLVILIQSFCIQAEVLDSVSYTQNITIEDGNFVHQINTKGDTLVQAKIILLNDIEIQNLNVKLPDGTIIGEAQAPSAGIEIVRFVPSTIEEAFLSPTSTIFINIEAVSTGMYEIFGTSTNLTSNVPLEVNIQGIYSFEIVKSSSLMHPNVPNIVSVKMLNKDGLPVTHETVKAKVIKLGNVISQPIFVDDGSGSDLVENDGIYTAEITINSIGRYALEIESSISDSEVQDVYSVSHTELNVVTPFPIALTGEFVEVTEDTNANGLIDRLNIALKTSGSIPTGEEYSLVVTLETSTKKLLVRRLMISESDLPDVTLSFSGLKLWEKHESGPIKIRSASLNSTTGPARPGLRNIGVTSSYSKADFERPNEIVSQTEASKGF